MEIQWLCCVWMLLITQTELVCCEVEFLQRHAGESVVIPCVLQEKHPAPIGVELKRRWLDPGKVLFQLKNMRPEVHKLSEKDRYSVSGDPGTCSLNVTISQLRASDTDRYFCEFITDDSPMKRIPSMAEFFLYVVANVPDWGDVEHVETCAGGSAVLPCLPLYGGGSAVEGVSLKRQKGLAPVQLLYNSKHHHSSSSSSSSPSSTTLPPERIQLSTVAGLTGMIYNLTLLQLQPEDSAFYSCQLLVPGRPDSAALGSHVFFVSVQGGECGCSSYIILLYAVSSAVALLFILLIALLMLKRDTACPRVKPQPQLAIYEEMVGVHPRNLKKSVGQTGNLHLEEAATNAYSHSFTKSSTENDYAGAFSPAENQK
ncbi:cd7 antigen-like [Lampris incognitus]|uniref:cd7 antigen-like n=1 Tax=Lampris incognitus TaxID=2546036 RepID=UPI0024B5E5C9|nr:cd7 antigen-like [Lampris incognitus]